MQPFDPHGSREGQEEDGVLTGDLLMRWHAVKDMTPPTPHPAHLPAILTDSGALFPSRQQMWACVRAYVCPLPWTTSPPSVLTLQAQLSMFC